ncbi:hypothetical protein NDA12_005213 [Ustilago hordei]|nr:hypothetical protein NDA15_004598 [Ustilago hordei]KAJ1579704.1 hypothetical protein NDA12_005213 [Ustilago hordei]
MSEPTFHNSTPTNGHALPTSSSLPAIESFVKPKTNHDASLASTFQATPAKLEPANAPILPPTAEPLSSVGVQPAALVSQAQSQSQGFTAQSAPRQLTDSDAVEVKPYHGPIEITPAQLKFAQSTLKSLKTRREAAAFLVPVDPIALSIPHYPTIVKRPMDFGTIDIKLALTALVLKPNSKPGDKVKSARKFGLDQNKDYYRRIHDFDTDVRQVFFNCGLFNGPDSPYTHNAQVLEAAFDKYMNELPAPNSSESSADASAARARRPSNPVPTIRRSSSDLGGRPKREIHPPPPKDLPWANEPQSASSSSEMRKAARRKAAKKAAGSSAREQAHHAKVAQDELRFCTRIIDDLLKPTYSNLAWVFYDKPTMDFDWAPAYFQMIKKPIALRDIQKNIRAGQYAHADEFDADMQLLFQNCFTFNQPGSDVALMGEKLKAVYEDKMSRKPAPAPLPDYEESDEEDQGADEDQDDVQPEFLATLQEQISQLSSTLAMLEGAKNQNAGLIANTKNMLASLQESYASSGGSKKSKSKGTKRKASESGAASKKKSKAKSAGSPSASASASAAAAEYVPAKKAKSAGSACKKKPSTSNKKDRSSRRDDNSDEDIRTVTYEQKEELAAKITELSEERLDGAIRIINEDKPPNENDEEEIELDIDELSPKTLYKLYKYVVRPKKPAPTPNKNSKSAPLDGRKRGTGGIKKKNLDEGEEAERIARLQEQLNQFGNADAIIGGVGGAAGGHDDLVHSESSSDESGSDSDSD